MSCPDKLAFSGRIHDRSLLSLEGSTKAVYHLTLTIPNQAMPSFEPGDAVAIAPTNDPKTVDDLLSSLQIRGQTRLDATGCTVEEFLFKRANLHKPHPSLLRLASAETPLECLRQISPLSPQELPSLFLPLLPRYYSIASSHLINPNSIDLLIALVSYLIGDTLHQGVASGFLCKRAEIHSTPIPFDVRPARSFSLPKDPNAAVILIGAGMGIAPYRAFLQHRIATHSRGKTWLFFGERDPQTDFYYRDFILDLEKKNQLRLSLAFSRVSKDKVYVQHRMKEESHDLWEWIEKGASIYVCGDSHQMAKDVDCTLREIVMQKKNQTELEARAYLKALRQEHRYLTDTY